MVGPNDSDILYKGPVLKSFMRQVVIIEAHYIPRQFEIWEKIKEFLI